MLNPNLYHWLWLSWELLLAFPCYFFLSDFLMLYFTLVHLGDYQMWGLYAYYTLSHPIIKNISSDLEGVYFLFSNMYQFETVIEKTASVWSF